MKMRWSTLLHGMQSRISLKTVTPWSIENSVSVTSAAYVIAAAGIFAGARAEGEGLRRRCGRRLTWRRT